ncbi:hypothetical protein KQX54_015860 [Cotesia glomerata]|uniref:Uncharacterized protein n=1 Tax=Cotesia glomerata TaxID=32391 RepID=A0AAV7HDT9_COTGL|nr:hypothetical protein KQX54_015860 [Cotesia glomerata]
MRSQRRSRASTPESFDLKFIRGMYWLVWKNLARVEGKNEEERPRRVLGRSKQVDEVGRDGGQCIWCIPEQSAPTQAQQEKRLR